MECKDVLVSSIMDSAIKYCPADKLETLRNELCHVLCEYKCEYIGTALSTELVDPLPEAYKMWMVNNKINGMAKSTMTNYNYGLREFFEFVHKPLHEIDTQDVRNYMFYLQNVKKLKNSTIRNKRARINSFFSWCACERIIPYNPCAVVKPIKLPKRLRKYLDSMEVEKIRNSCASLRERALFEFMYSTGCRVSEVVAMNIDDLNMFEHYAVVYHGKGDKERKVPLNPRAILAIEEYLEHRPGNDVALFTGDIRPYRRISVDTVQKTMKRLAQRSGIKKKFSPHVVRHTTATTCIEHGMPIEDVQMLLGHANINTTTIYAETNFEKVKNEHLKCVI